MENGNSDHKRKISNDFHYNEVALSFLATCLVLTICSFARLRVCYYWLDIPASLFILQLIRGSRDILKWHIFVASANVRRMLGVFQNVRDSMRCPRYETPGNFTIRKVI
ncbi:hypothetical protein AVEN_183456-1 [Araneus ventricosus]|uniref:Uncharacterized protein n=1 Tax=Araneus ventricosus TaxID=182803 RepID=A0A4Y2EF60_ARAVE|nr:hypothetical protein AVEN_183456-1 [Araneus ventricosus]